MKKACVGAMDKTPPKETTWGTFPNRLFFGRESTVTWGVKEDLLSSTLSLISVIKLTCVSTESR